MAWLADDIGVPPWGVPPWGVAPWLAPECEPCRVLSMHILSQSAMARIGPLFRRHGVI
jgi:hypothetical protein